MNKGLLSGLVGVFKLGASANNQKKSSSEEDIEVYLNGERRQVPSIELQVLKAMSERGGRSQMVTGIAVHLGWHTGCGGVVNALTGLSARGLVEARVGTVLLGQRHQQRQVYDIVEGCEIRHCCGNDGGPEAPAP